MKLKIFKSGNSYAVRLPRDVVEPFIESGEIELVIPEKIAVELETSKEKKSVLPSAGEVEMTKEEKIEALRKLMEMGGPVSTVEEAIPEPEEVSDEPVLYDDSQDVPQEYVLKPGYEHLRGRK